MSALSHIARAIDKKQLTAIVRAGEGQRPVELFLEARLNQSGAGMIFMEKVLRGHPMMPFEGANW
jgi:hypothetical protein